MLRYDYHINFFEVKVIFFKKILFIDSALYGGYSAVVYPYSKANTPAMGDKYREDRPRSDIIMTVKKKKKIMMVNV